ncbi:MAG: MIP/aquaporin family protein [Planctomycetaceae bacterium]
MSERSGRQASGTGFQAEASLGSLCPQKQPVAGRHRSDRSGIHGSDGGQNAGRVAMLWSRLPFPSGATHLMSPYVAEFVGTMMLVLLGNGVCANVNLKKTLGHNAGWIVIATGWGLAVAFAVYLVSHISGAHLNPAVTIGLAVIGEFEVPQVAGYLASQMLGAITGATLVWLAYLPHWKETTDAGAIRGSFCNTPAIPHTISNLITEIIGTFALVLGVLAILRPENLMPDTGFKEGFAPCLVGLMVWSIGLSLGGPTGYAINPARDLGPRIAHALLPIANKGNSGWGYSWIPVVGPIVGGITAAVFYKALWSAA